MQFLDLEDAQYLIDRLGFIVKDAGLLDSALARPAASAFGEYAYPNIETMAAAMHQSLVKNHSLIDGNKRSAWMLLNAFLRINGCWLEMTADQGLDFTLSVATGEADLESAAAIIKKHLKQHP